VQTLASIRALLDARGLAPRKALGQNFLIDHNLIAKLVDAAWAAAAELGLGSDPLVLEIGPGTGALTHALLDRGARVVASELDAGLAGLLRETVPPRRAGEGSAMAPARFTLVEGDCLAGKHALNPAVLAAVDGVSREVGERFLLVANLPYAAATPAMLALLADHPRCVGMFVTIQQEVADRMLAGPGSRDYGPLSVLVAITSRAWQIARLPPECFWPRPGVRSAMVGVVRGGASATLASAVAPSGAMIPAMSPAPSPRAIVDFAQALFVQRRKQIGSVLARRGVRDAHWPPGVVATSRAEDLTPAQFIALYGAVGALDGPNEVDA
jgi:16S rRNA (adenine1518-N6/adenine1519-N6)-dimethyltransferase